MQLFLYLLIALNVFLPVALIRKCCVVQGRLTVDHIFLFNLGFLAYWILPMVAGVVRLYDSNLALKLWYTIFDNVPTEAMTLYAGICLSVFLAFFAGTLVGQIPIREASPTVDVFPFPRRLFSLALGAGLLLSLLAGFQVRNELFSGYRSISEDAVGPRGTFIASSLFLLTLAFLYAMRMERERPGVSFVPLIRNRYFAAYLIVAILVLSLGGRLYFISSLLMVLVYRSVYFQSFKLRNVFVGSLGLVVVLAALGIVRMGSGLRLEEIGISTVAEPIYTSFSLFAFLKAGRLEFLNFPRFLISDFTNLIPSALLPGKAALLLDPKEVGYTVYSPLGALHSFVSMMINFGILGIPLMVFLFAAVMNYLKRRRDVRLYRLVYILTSGWIATSLFRDPFSVSIVKNIVQFSVLLPVLMLFGLHFLFLFLRPVPAEETSTAGGSPQTASG